MAAIFSRVLGKDVSYVPVSHEAALESLSGMGLPQWIAEGYVELSRGFEAGYADTTTDGVEASHPPRDFVNSRAISTRRSTSCATRPLSNLSVPAGTPTAGR